MSEMNSADRRQQFGRLSQKISTQFVMTVLIYLLVLTGGYFLAYFICSRFIWQVWDPLYQFLKVLEAAAPVLILVAVLVGVFFITRFYISKALRYLDGVIDAAEQMAVSPEKPVRLPADMVETQNELNLVRERTLNAARDAREAEQKKNDLVVYLAHDLKTPLTSVIGYLSLLRDEPELSEGLRNRYTGVALSKAQRLEELINEFFEITRFNLSHLELDRQSVDLTRMLEQITSEFQPVLTEKGLRWESRLESGVTVFCDPDKLERVFDNLFRNAVHYSYPDTPIRLTLTRETDRVRMTVSNRGRTIAAEKLERIFDQFYRIDPSRGTSTGGAGLGLAIAREIVELHGGQIRAESASETVTFTVELPVRKS